MCSLAEVGQKTSLYVDIPDIHGLIRTVRRDLAENSDEFRAAVLLLAGPSLRFNIDRLSRRTRYPRQFVAKCARRLVDNGVWLQERSLYLWFSPQDESFWRDVDVAVGKAYRRVGANGDVEWGQVRSWRKKYDFGHDADAPISTTYLSDTPAAVTASTAAHEVEEIAMLEPRALDVLPARALAALHTVSEPAPERKPVDVPPARPALPELFPGAVWL